MDHSGRILLSLPRCPGRVTAAHDDVDPKPAPGLRRLSRLGSVGVERDFEFCSLTYHHDPAREVA